LALFATAALFVAICFVVPSRFISAGHARALEIENEVAELTAKVEILKDEKLLESSRAELFQERLQQVKQDASGEDPVRTWESLDHLENTISREAEKVAHASLDLTDKLTKSETLAEALLRSGADSNNSEVMAEALQEFLGAIGGSAESSVLAKDLLAGDWKKGALSPDRLKSLSQSLRLTKAEILERLQRLHRLKLIDLDVVTRCKGLGKCNPAALAAFLGQDPGKASVADLVQALGSAPTRGRGDAEMTLRDEVSENGAKFKNEALPPSAIVDQGELIGLSAGAPTASKAPSITNPGALDNAATAGGGAHTQVVLPRHRGTVKRYFDRP